MSKQQTNEQPVSLPWFGLNRLGRFMKRYAKVYVTMVVLGLLGSVIDIIIPLFQRTAINDFILNNTLKGIGLFIAAYIGVLILQTIFNSISAYLAFRTELNINRDLRQTCFEHLQTLSLSYYNQNSVGYIHARVMSDTSRIGDLVSWGLMDVVWNLSYIIGVVVMMFVINWQLALLVMVIVPFLLVAAAFFQKKLVVLNRRIRETNSQITGNFNEGITGAKTTKTLVIENKMDSDFRETTRRMFRISTRTGAVRGLFTATIALAASAALAMVLWRGGLITMEGVMLIGTLSVFATYAMNLMDPVQSMVRAAANLVTVQVNIERVTRLLETKSEVSDTPEVVARYGDTFAPKKENWEAVHGDITFDDVSFHYPDSDEYVLEHFNLHVPQGTNVAIVGETGAGKSTLVNLVCRFFEPSKGRILIDGKDARERSQLWLHSNIGYVLQTPHLFSGTVLDNLRYGKPDATMEEVERAVRLVSADGVIARLEKGYDTEVGEGGDLLSTGEKQLISFARAILSDPRIFILDEATSSIDTKTEQLIQNAIDTVLRGRTSFIIAHRLSTIRHADIILVIDDGKIVESGTHEALMDARGAYYKLYTRQFEEENTRRVMQNG